MLGAGERITPVLIHFEAAPLRARTPLGPIAPPPVADVARRRQPGVVERGVASPALAQAQLREVV